MLFSNGQLTIDNGVANDASLVITAASNPAGDRLVLNGQTALDQLNRPVVTSTVSTLQVLAGAGNNLVDMRGMNVLQFPLLANGSISVWGEAGNDTLWGSPLGETLDGGNGDDWLNGGAGDDGLRGGAGSDSYIFSGITGLGADIVSDGGTTGNDTLDFSGLELGKGITLLLSHVAPQQVIQSSLGSLWLDLADSPEIETVIGTPLHDFLVGDAIANRLVGNGGSDRIWGAAGADVIEGGPGNDYWLEGGEGDDEVVGGDGDDHFLLGSAGNDILDGGNGHEYLLYGDAGDDRLEGGSGDDRLSGGAGNDVYVFAGSTGLGQDQIVAIVDDDLDVDTLDFSLLESSSGIVVDLTTTASQPVAGDQGSLLWLEIHTAGQLENVVGSPGHDRITGNDQPNTLWGRDGNDILRGGRGDDTLEGGAGDDIYEYRWDNNLGHDTLREVAGEGLDAINLSPFGPTSTIDLGSSAPQPIASSLSITLAQSHVIEQVIGGVVMSQPVAVNDDYHGIAEDKSIVRTPGNGLLTNDLLAPGGLPIVQLVTGPAHGGLTLEEDGSFVYAPDANFVGTDQFVYAIDQDGTTSNSATVRLFVSPKNDPPALNPISNLTVNENDTVFVPLQASDPESPANSLTYQLEPGTPPWVQLTANHQLMLNPGYLAGGQTYAVTVRVTDNGSSAASSFQTFAVSVIDINRPPTIQTPSNLGSWPENSLVSFIASAVDPDPGDQMTYALDGAPPGATIDGWTGLFQWQTEESMGPGTYTFDLVVSDNSRWGLPAVAYRTVSLQVVEVNQPPTLAIVGNRSAFEHEEIELRAIATDPDLPAQTLIYSLPAVDAAITGYSFDTSTGFFRWQPNDSHGGQSYQVTFAVKDGTAPNAATTQQTVTLTVSEANQPPQFDPWPSPVDATGVWHVTFSPDTPTQAINVTVSAQDPDSASEALTFLPPTTSTVPRAPTHAPVLTTIDHDSAQFSWTLDRNDGPGTYAVDLRVRDTTGLEGETRFLAVVSATLPVITLEDLVVLEGEQSAQLTVSLSQPSWQTITVGYQTHDDTAIEDTDYLQGFGTVTFEPGVTSATITIPLIADTDPEVDERFLVELLNPMNGVVLDTEAVVTIVDDSPALPGAGGWIAHGEGSVSMSGTSVVVHMGVPGRDANDLQPIDYHGASRMIIPATSSSIPFQRNVSSWDSYNAATGPGSGYYDSFSISVTDAPYPQLALTDPITFPHVWPTSGNNASYLDGVITQNSGSGSVPLPATPGTPRFLNVVLDTATLPAADLSYPSWGTMTLQIPSVLTSFITATAYSSSEGNGTAYVAIRLLDGAGPASVHYETLDGTAQSGSDYAGVSGTVQLTALEPVALIPIDITNDSQIELPETFTLYLSSPSGAALPVQHFSLSITDNDPESYPTIAPPVARSDGPYVVFHRDVIASASGLRTNDTIHGTSQQFVVTRQPQHGTVMIDPATGNFTYDPHDHYVGEDSFAYRFTDIGPAYYQALTPEPGRLASNEAEVKISVVDRLPVLGSDHYRVIEGDPLVVSAANGLLANDSDPDNDSMFVYAIVPRGNPPLGILTQQGNSGAFSYQTAVGATGADPYEYWVSDSITGPVTTGDLAVNVLNAEVNLRTDMDYNGTLDLTDEVAEAAGNGRFIPRDGSLHSLALSRYLEDRDSGSNVLEYEMLEELTGHRLSVLNSRPDAVTLWLDAQGQLPFLYSDYVYDGIGDQPRNSLGQPLPPLLYAQGLATGQAAVDLVWRNAAGIVIAQDSVLLKIFGVDVDIDTFNNSGFALPADDPIADAQEESAPGKYIPVNDGDVDADRIPDYADGYDLLGPSHATDNTSIGVNFTPIVIRISNTVDPNRAQLEFSYFDSHPNRVLHSGTSASDGERHIYRPADDGALRLWKRDGSSARLADPLFGDYLAPNFAYRVSEFPITPVGSYWQIVVYAEGVRPSSAAGDEWLFVQLTPTILPTAAVDGGQVPSVVDLIRATTVQVNVSIDSDNNNGTSLPSRSPDEELFEDDPTQPGKVVVASRLDQNGNGVPDYADGINIHGNGGINRVGPFTPMTISIPSWIDLERARVRLDYAHADPGLVSRSPGPPYNYDLGSANPLRIWTKDGVSSRNVQRIDAATNPGDFVPMGVYPASALFAYGSNTVTLYVEGTNESAEGAARIVVEIDPDGSGFVHQDAVRATVAHVQIVYTDVTGLTGIGNTLAANVPRIDPELEPDGIATDRMPGVADGAMLVMRVVGSPILQTLAERDPKNFVVQFGYLSGPQSAFGPLPRTMVREGRYRALEDDSFVPNANVALQALGIATIGQEHVANNRRVLAATFYQPPDEFDLAFPLNPLKERPLHLAIDVQGAVTIAGSKTNSITLTRPPLVLVHGVNSGPTVWDQENASFVNRYDVDTNNFGFVAKPFRVDHSGFDPVDSDQDRNGAPGNLTDPTHGFGDVTHMYQLVAERIDIAANAFRTGNYFTPLHTGLAGKRIAVQKVDVVAHSYGGLLTRWYIELAGAVPGQAFRDQRDVRKLITLGTPHKGSPLTNVITEVIKDGLIAHAQSEGVLTYEPLMRDLLCALDRAEFQTGCDPLLLGLLTGNSPNALTTDRRYARHALEVMTINSERLAQLNAQPFHPDVAYAAIIGTDRTKELGIDLYHSVTPIYNEFSVQNGQPYFPWIREFDAGPDDTDGVVPHWSAALGVASHNRRVEAEHGGMPSVGEIQDVVRAWLNGANPDTPTSRQAVPLGSQQRAQYNTQIPVSHRNAYVGSVVQADGYSRGGGLRREAIVKVELDPTDTSAFYGTNGVTWGSDAAGAGVHRPVLTGMIRVADIGATQLTIYSDESTDRVLHNLGVVAANDLQIPAWALQGAGPNDWVPFRVDIGTIGRRQAAKLTGPSGDGDLVFETQYVSYGLTAPVIPGVFQPPAQSPPTRLSLPAFTLPPPSKGGPQGLTLTLSGSVEVRGAGGTGSQVNTIRVYDDDLIPLYDLLDQTDLTIAHPASVWNGLLIPYTTTVTLTIDEQGHVRGPLGSSGEAQAEVYQYLIDPNANSVSSDSINVP